jgi:hypothetical protein
MSIVDTIRQKAHESGVWINKAEESVRVIDMSDSYLINVLKYQFKIASAMQVLYLQKCIDQLGALTGPFALRGEYARDTVDYDLDNADWERLSDLPEIDELLEDMPIVKHLYVEVRRRNLLHNFTDEQKAQLYLAVGGIK